MHYTHPLHVRCKLNHVYHPHSLHSPQPHLLHPPHQHCRHPHTLSAYIHATPTTVHVSQSHRLPRHRQTKDNHTTTDTIKTHRSNSKHEITLIIMQVNINGIKNKLEELKLLIHDTHEDIITFQETKLTPKVNTLKVHNYTTVRTDKLHKEGCGLITFISDNITFTTKDIPSTINTHNT